MESNLKPLPSNQKYVNVILLDGEQSIIAVEVKWKVQDLFDQVCMLVGFKDDQLFGLSIARQESTCVEYEFLEPKNKISKYAPKGWKTDSGSGLDKSGKPILQVWFRVQLYVEHVSLLKDDATRHHYYLQLKQNILSAPVLFREEACFVLASYALQADLGNYSDELHKAHYFDPYKYFPEWVIRRRGQSYILKHVPMMHRDQRGTTKVYAQKAFIREASTTIEHTMHLYRLKKVKTEETPSIWLGICTRGIQLYEDSGEGKYLLCEYAWNIIKRLVFQKKKFELQVEGVSDGRKINYYTGNEAKSKHLLRLCKLTHAFQMKTQPIVDRARKRENIQEKKRYRESYISTDVSWSDLDSSMTISFTDVSNKKELQRRSVVSHGSSATTSGIVSDERPQMEKSLSEAENEADDLAYVLDGDLTKKARAAMSPTGLSQLDNTLTRREAGQGNNSYPLSTPDVPVQHGVSNSVMSNNYNSLGGFRSSASDSDDEDDEPEDRRCTHRKEHTKDRRRASPQSGPLQIVDPRKIQEEIQGKVAAAPFLNALCNDRTLLLMQIQQRGESYDNLAGNELYRTESDPCRTPSSQSSGRDGTVSADPNDINTSLTTLVSHSSIDSDVHKLHSMHNSSSLLASQSLAKHQTVSGLNSLPDQSLSRFDARYDLQRQANNRLKCQTLPSKMTASEQMLLLGGSGVIKEECVSYSAPNLSPGAQVAIPGCS
ncbi:FERM domain-containing protein 6-like [Anneissia japonica]|uniref:FERM domain-containing protein 6-like n=1 Tax=Anneissia japonica TaxID=1529436 RepID=UPI0014254C30|nr:FERM domain-containing protein 6-like [Anneissia japonica]